MRRAGAFLLCVFFLGNLISLSAQSTDSTKSQLRYPLESKYSYPFSTSGTASPLLMPPPSNVEQKVVYDPETNSYIFSEKIGQINYRPAASMSFEEYNRYQQQKAKKAYWDAKSKEESGAGPSFLKGLRLGNTAIDKVFGSEGISITPQGSAELIFGYSITNSENPAIPVRNQRNGSFIFKEKIMMNVTGSIGDKMEVGLNYNTEATFDFENKTKLEYSGKEDEIIKKIEAGDVSFPLPGTLITGSQSLFGIRTELQFGKLTVSTVLSHQRSESSSINVQGGAQQTEFEIDIDQYDVNRHFFLSHFFRDNYNVWLENLPHIESQLKIEEIEVWVVNKQNDFTNSRDVLAVMDLGEGYNPEGLPNFQANPNTIYPSTEYNQPASNDLNRLYSDIASNNNFRNQSTIDVGFASISDSRYTYAGGRDYQGLESARPLSTREYTVNRELGYISLNSPLRNDEILAVSYVYTYKGQRYAVGELSRSVEAPNVLVVKLLKGITQTPLLANWDLMMKNIYSIGAYQVSSEDFVLNILYRNDETGAYTNYLTGEESDFAPEIVGTDFLGVYKQQLLKVLELDNLDARREPYPDGMFDFAEGITINSRNGRVIFPVVEPFGSYMEEQILGDNPSHRDYEKFKRSAKKYVFHELYDSTQTKAQQVAEKNKFVLKGHYKSSSSSDIQLNAMNIPRGSVKVLAGGRELIENTDYTVDYTLGRVKILNQGIVESGTPIQIKLESNSLFNMQTKTLLGTHLDYKFSENFNLGGTILRLTERPLTNKVNIGEEPISNTIWGLNTSYRTESQLLTSVIDKIPLLETKEVSSFALDAEFAQLIPGQSKMIGKNGIAYIDDFEGAQTKIELKTFPSWNLSSAPNDPRGTFYRSNELGLPSGYGRAKLSWYIIDPLFYGTSSFKPGNVDVTSHEVRQIKQKELFPNRDDEISGFESRLSVFNLNFYPGERGPYNYDADNGILNNPQDSWGGIMREIVTTDFEASNIEFIEFWLMDPYVEREGHAGGEMYFHLGEISEDILRDGKKSFENGFPTTDELINVDSTIWGYVPAGKSLVNAFDYDPDARERQDIGLDGLNDIAEGEHFQEFKNLPDPAGDNFDYYLSSDHDDNAHDILRRYKNYNGLEKNSPVAEKNGSDYAAANKTTPDVEDINRDNTLNNAESYFQYHVSLRPEDFQVGSNYIVDSREIRNVEGNPLPVTWYQFRVPIDDWESKVGGIEDFRSIRFMRIMLNGFEQDVVIRFATLSLIRGEWRRYKQDIYQSAPTITDQTGETVLEVSSVNIEENGAKIPVNYMLPPGITRMTDPNQPQVRQLNEQSLLLKAYRLPDNDARAVFKNVQLDLRQYKNLEMFIHATEIPGSDDQLLDNELSVFVRIGSDYQNNYYEYEVPLTITPPGQYNTDENGEYKVWPTVNNIKLELEKLVNLKIERNIAMKDDPFIDPQNIYIKEVEKPVPTDKDEFGKPGGFNKIKVKGNPNLSNIRQIMIGIRNPGDDATNVTNDGEAKSAEIWVNELRLTEFNNKGGWAANGQFQAKLADLGIVSFAGATSKPGFGSIEQTVEERQKEEINQIDFSTNLELGKFFPEKAKVSIPMFIGYSNTTINPEYNPQDPDVKLKDALDLADTEEERAEIKRNARDVTERKSFNLTNVRWNKQLKKAKIISPSNLSATVAYSETNSRNYSLEYNKQRKYGASLNYVFNNRPKPVTPFNKTKAFRKPALRIIRDFNFNYQPSAFTFSTKFDRDYQSMKMRNVYANQNIDLIIEPTTSKGFYWDRDYTLRWDLTRALKFDYNASNRAIIDEPIGPDDWFESNNKEWKDSVRVNISNGGRNMQFNQKWGLTYTLPLSKIPFLNWTNFKASYDATYNWTRGPLLLDQEDILGHTLKNSNSIKLTSNFNMKNLYNKVGYFKRLDSKYSGKRKSKKDVKYKTVEYTKKTFFKKGQPKNIIHKLGTEEVTVKVLDVEGTEKPVKLVIISDNKITLEADEDLSGVTVFVEGKIEKGENPFIFVGENAIRFVLGIKNINLSYNRTGSTMLPGYLPETNILGFDMGDFNGAPGWPFILGWQDDGILEDAYYNGWMTQNPTFSSPTIFAVNETFNYRTTFEPFEGFRIDVTGMRTHSHKTEQDYFNYLDNPFGDKYRGGNFSISTITIGSAFENVSKDNNWQSNVYNKFRDNRTIISKRLSNRMVENNPEYYQSLSQRSETGYSDGYGSTSSEVLMYAFQSAYTDRDPANMPLEMFSWLALPNWKVTFDGLSKIGFIQKFLKTLTLTHSYKSTYSISSYGTNVDFFPQNDEPVNLQGLFRDAQNNFIIQYQPSGVSINEQLAPLISFDMTWHNSLLSKFEIRRTRMLALSLNNSQLTESRNRDYVFGAGYRFKDVPLNLTTTGGTKTIKSDLNIRFDLSIRDNITILRSVSQITADQVTTGARKFVLSLTADYVLSQRVNIQFYFDRNVNTPYVSNYYPNSETNFGFSLRMSL